MSIEIRQAEYGEHDDAFEDLIDGDGIASASLLILHGHHIAALASLASREAITATICERLRRRGGGSIADEIVAADVGSTSFRAKLEHIAQRLRMRAQQLTEAKLATVINSDAAKQLCAFADAWLGAPVLPSTEIAAVAEHVTAGGEVWGGLGDGGRFMIVPILRSGLDPATEPALELDVDAVPLVHSAGVAARLRFKTDPDTMIGDEQTLRLVRAGTVMICHAVDDRSATYDEATQTLRLELTRRSS
jgi:hypothetical protein